MAAALGILLLSAALALAGRVQLPHAPSGTTAIPARTTQRR